MGDLNGYFITGTDTGIGKTWVACGLITGLRERGHRVMGMKPVASGCVPTAGGLRNEDALALQAVSSLAAPYEVINPYAFEPPIAPHIAAQEVGAKIAFGEICARSEQLMGLVDMLVVEGVGGWRVPLGEEGDVEALAATLKLPVVLVVGVRLGCINHAFLTAESIGLSLAGWVANLVDPAMERLADNLQTLCNGITAPYLGMVPFLQDYQPQVIASCLDLTLLSGAAK